jgi:hypothetical protein
MRITFGEESKSRRERVTQGREAIGRIVSMVEDIERRADAARSMVGRKRTTIERRALRLLFLDLDELWTDLHGHSGLHASRQKRAHFTKFAYIVAQVANIRKLGESVLDRAFQKARQPDRASEISGTGSGQD